MKKSNIGDTLISIYFSTRINTILIIEALYKNPHRMPAVEHNNQLRLIPSYLPPSSSSWGTCKFLAVVYNPSKLCICDLAIQH